LPEGYALSEERITLEDVRKSIEVLTKASTSLLSAPLESALKMLPASTDLLLHAINLKISFLKALKSIIEGEISFLEKIRSEKLGGVEVKKEKVSVE